MPLELRVVIKAICHDTFKGPQTVFIVWMLRLCTYQKWPALSCLSACGQFSLAPSMYFHYIRIWSVAWKHHGLLNVATVTRGQVFSIRVNCEWTSHSSENNSKNVSIGYLEIMSFWVYISQLWEKVNFGKLLANVKLILTISFGCVQMMLLTCHWLLVLVLKHHAIIFIYKIIYFK